MIFSLDVIRARKGDCLILHYGTKDDPHMVMIDGGPSGVYVPHLRDRLVQIREARGLDNEAPLFVDLLMVSHVDDVAPDLPLRSGVDSQDHVQRLAALRDRGHHLGRARY